MPDDGTGSDYEVAMCEQLPTQIYSASLMAEVDVIKRQHGNINQPNILSGTATIINKYYDMILKNNLAFPVIVRIGYNEYNTTSKLYCEVYRPPMENAALLRSVIHEEGSKTLVDIKRVYINEKGDPVNSILIETIVKEG
jgi:vancomycin resistance protein YoaR